MSLRYRRKLVVQILLICLVFKIHGQPSDIPDREVITMDKDSLWLNGFSLFNQYKFEEAAEAYKVALKFAPTFVDSLICYNYIALQYQSIQQHDSAVHYLEKVMSVDPEPFVSFYSTMRVVRAYYLRHTIHISEGEYESAIHKLETALDYLVQDSIELYERINYRIDLASLYFDMGDLERAKRESHKAATDIDIINITPLQKKKLSVKNNGNLGIYYFDSGDPERAANYFSIILSDTVFMDSYDTEPYYVYYRSIGDVYLDLQEIDSSIYFYNRSLDRAEKDNNPGLVTQRPYIKSTILSRLGDAYRAKKEFDRAEEYYEQGYNIAFANYNNDISWLMPHLMNMAIIKRERGNYEDAIDLAFQSLTLSRNKYGKVNGQASPASYNFISEFFLYQKDFDQALIYVDSALISNEKLITDDKPFYAQSEQFFESVRLKLNCLISNKKASTYKDQLNQLYSIFKSQINTREVDYGLTSTTNNINESYHTFYKSFKELHAITKKDEYLANLWEISELNKARELMTEIAIKSLLIKQLPFDDRVREKNIRDSIIYYTNELSTQGNKASVRLPILKEERYHILSRAKNSMMLTGLLNAELNLSLVQYQSSLPHDQITLSFYDDDHDIHAMYISADSVAIHSYDKKLLSSLIVNLKEELNDSDQSYDVSIIVRDSLINKYIDLQEYSTLEVIPDGIIWDINFGALKRRAHDEENEISTFLGLEKNIVYQFSENLKQLQKNLSSGGKEEVLGISYLATPENISLFRSYGVLGDLPGSREELSMIAQDWKGKFYFDGITESEFVESADEYNILHIALHSLLDSLRPSFSSLIFSEKDSVNDGRLYSYEVENMDLSVNMAVISACQSGNGKIRNGEGLMSLARSFAIGGCKSIVSSKWDVSDFSSPIIMRYFYSGLKKGLTKSNALKNAQINYLQNHANGYTSHPKYWSSFFIIGDDSEIVQSSFGNKLWLLIGVGILLLALSFRKKIFSTS